MSKKLKDVTLFLSGDPKKSYPPRVYATYRIVSGNAVSKVLNVVIDDPDTSTSLNEFWKNIHNQIKSNEGIE